MKKSLFSFKTLLLIAVLAYGCGSGSDRTVEDSGKDPADNTTEEAPAVDSAAPMADSSMGINPAYRNDQQEVKREKERSGSTEKTKKSQSIQQ